MTTHDDTTTAAAQLRGLAADLGVAGPLTLELGTGSARLHPADPVTLELERDGRSRRLEVPLAAVTDRDPTDEPATAGDAPTGAGDHQEDTPGATPAGGRPGEH